MGSRRRLLAAVVFSAACSTAHADRPIAPPPAGAQIALGIAPTRLRAPYDVQILRSNGETLPTFGLRDRFYVQGNASERYIIRIANPTSRRIEAVVSVDGLDVIDGENGDLRKRGYVVPAYGETRIEGFRTSQEGVATFRFSSVSGSYAGQKGKPRNVGVIAVALFEELAPPPEQQIVGELAPPPPRRPQYESPSDDRDDLDHGAAPAPSASHGSAKAGRAETTASAGAKRAAEPAPAVRRAPPPPAPTGGNGGYAPPSDPGGDDEMIAPPSGRPAPEQHAQRERLGLGTEFGEQRSSVVNYTQFVRAPGRPVAIAELRYNDTAGLMALGIPVQPLPDAGELMVRETADPFPGDRYAKPPR
jgi:hypothetical protein